MVNGNITGTGARSETVLSAITVSNNAISETPEPSTYLLIGTGLALIGFKRFRRA